MSDTPRCSNGESVVKKADQLKLAVAKAARPRNGKRILGCKQALVLAAAYGVPPRRVGRICDAEGIKLRQCLLGCF